MSEIKVLDHGHVRLLDCYGGDDAVVRAARQCYCSESSGPEADRRLIKRLLTSKPRHGSPFEFATLVYHIKLPLFVRDQMVRHRMASYAVKSLRYCRLEDLEVYEPFERPMESPGAAVYHKLVEESFETYRMLLNDGWKPERARCVLPSGTYTEMLWQVNARSLMNYLAQRLDHHAQGEHRQYADAIYALWEDAMPITAIAWYAATFEGGEPRCATCLYYEEAGTDDAHCAFHGGGRREADYCNHYWNKEEAATPVENTHE